MKRSRKVFSRRFLLTFEKGQRAGVGSRDFLWVFRALGLFGAIYYSEIQSAIPFIGSRRVRGTLCRFAFPRRSSYSCGCSGFLAGVWVRSRARCFSPSYPSTPRIPKCFSYLLCPSSNVAHYLQPSRASHPTKTRIVFSPALNMAKYSLFSQEIHFSFSIVQHLKLFPKHSKNFIWK